MAYTLKRYASNYSSVSNEMVFVVEESVKTADPVTYPDYKFIADVYVGGVFKGRLRAFPDPTYKFGVFDVSKILQPFFTYRFDIDEIIDYPVVLDYQIKFGEEYDGVLYTNVLTDSTRKAANTYVTYPYSSSVKLATGLASNMPLVRTAFHDPTLYPSDSFTHLLIPYWGNASGINSITATYKDKNNNTLNTAVLSDTRLAGYLRQYNIGNGSTRTVRMDITGDVSLTINVECTKHPVRTIAWLNPFGGYESQHFAMVSKYKKEIERKSYTRNNFTIYSDGTVYPIEESSTGNIYIGGKRGFATKSTQKWELSSHILSDDEYEWLGDLLSSPDVYMHDPLVGWVPVLITNSNYERRTYLNSRMDRRLELEVEFSNPYNAQFL